MAYHSVFCPNFLACNPHSITLMYCKIFTVPYIIHALVEKLVSCTTELKTSVLTRCTAVNERKWYQWSAADLSFCVVLYHRTLLYNGVTVNMHLFCK